MVFETKIIVIIVFFLCVIKHLFTGYAYIFWFNISKKHYITV